MFRKSTSKTSGEFLVRLVSVALLIALQVVLSRFLSIQLWNLKIGFSFVPVVIAARLYGPLYSVMVYALGDVIGTFLFPTGPYFPGFTFTAVVSGLIFGLLLQKKSTPVKIISASVLNQIICSLLLNTFWISYTAGVPFLGQLSVRWPQSVGMCAVQIILMLVGLEKICTPIEKLLSKNSR